VCQAPHSLWHGGTELIPRGARTRDTSGNGRKVLCHAVAQNSPGGPNPLHHTFALRFPRHSPASPRLAQPFAQGPQAALDQAGDGLAAAADVARHCFQRLSFEVMQR